MRRTIVAVVGASDPDATERTLAFRTGRLIARAGWVLLTGGLGGVMEEHVEISVATGIGEARNAVIANTADALISIGGGLGTLTEIAFALRRGKRVVGLRTWALDRSRLGEAPWSEAATPEEAVERVREWDIHA